MVAERQTSGRGRLGRRWVSPAHVNLYASVVLRPTLSPADAPQICLAAALAVARTLEPFAPGRVAIKWPNDCLLDGRKVAGILTEMDAELDRVHWVVLGIGVNLNVQARAFPAELRDIATSVRLATGAKVDRVAFAAALCDALEDVYDRAAARGLRGVDGRLERVLLPHVSVPSSSTAAAGGCRGACAVSTPPVDSFSTVRAARSASSPAT